MKEQLSDGCVDALIAINAMMKRGYLSHRIYSFIANTNIQKPLTQIKFELTVRTQ
jgi:hypothetical protein